MYSFPELNKQYYESYLIKVNGKEYNTYKLKKEQGDVLRTNALAFIRLKENNFKDEYYYKKETKNKGLLQTILYDQLVPDYIYENLFYLNVDEDKFGRWYKEKIEAFSRIQVHDLCIYKIKYDYDSEGKPIRELNEILIYQY